MVDDVVVKVVCTEDVVVEVDWVVVDVAVEVEVGVVVVVEVVGVVIVVVGNVKGSTISIVVEGFEVSKYSIVEPLFFRSSAWLLVAFSSVVVTTL